MERLHIILEDAQKVKDLETALEKAQVQIEELKTSNHNLVMKHGREVLLNNELIDLCRANDIQFRELLDNNERKKRFG